MGGSCRCVLPLLAALLFLVAAPCRAGTTDWMRTAWHRLAARGRAAAAPTALAGPVCLDAAGQPVDWWLALKLPGGPMWARLDSRGAAEALGASLGGTERVEGRFRFSPDTLDDGASNSSLARTLGQLAAGAGADGAAAPGHVMFNRRAEGARRDSGPANGVMGYGAQQGFLLLHTVPGFPMAPPQHSGGVPCLPLMEAAAGHRFLCVSLALPQLTGAARTLAAARPHVYSAAAPAGGDATGPGLGRQAGTARSDAPAQGPLVKRAADARELTGSSINGVATADLAGELAAAAEVRGDARGVAWDAEIVSLAGERFVALAAAETADLWADVVQPRLDAGQPALLTAAPCLHGPANGSAFEAPHGRPDWALAAPSAAHAAPDSLCGRSPAHTVPWQVTDPTSPVSGGPPANTREALAGSREAALGRGSVEGADDILGNPESGLRRATEALQSDSAAAFVEHPARLESGSRPGPDAEALAVLRSLQPGAAAELELAAPGAQTAEPGAGPLTGTAESRRRVGRRLATAAAAEGPGSRAGLGSLDAARARAAAVAAWWRQVSAGQVMAPKRATEPEQALTDPKQRPGPASARSAPASTAAAARGFGVIAAEERRLREAATAVGAPLPRTFTADFDEVARDFAEGASGDLAAGARLAAASFDEVLFQGRLFAPPRGLPAQPIAFAGNPVHAHGSSSGEAADGEDAMAVAGSAAIANSQQTRRPCEHVAGGAAAQRWAVCFGEGPAAGGARGPGSALCFAGNRFVWEARPLRAAAPHPEPLAAHA